MRALVTEHDSESRRLLCEALQGRGHDVCPRTSSDERDALEEPFALVFGDLATVRAVTRDHSHAGPKPVVVLLTTIECATPALLQHSGADDCLTKPLDPQQLAFRIHAAERLAQARVSAAATERQLLAADRLVTLGTLTAAVAHELKSPLLCLCANADFLLEELQALELSVSKSQLETSHELVKDLRDNAERMRIIVQDLKGFGRTNEASDGPADVRRAAEWALRIAGGEIRMHARVELNCELVPQVRMSEVRLSQVLLNLLVNATHSIASGNPNDNRIAISAQARPGGVLVEVSDTGAGMSEEVVRRAFEPFFTTKPAGLGTGLGLSICRKLIETAGGEISVQSELGRGTTFRLMLPAAEQSGVRPATKLPAAPVAASAMQILVVDDDPSIVRILDRALRGYTVTIARDGREALAQLRPGHNYGLVFCDLAMEGLSGMDVYSETVRAQPSMASRFVFLTGGAITEETEAFLAAIPNRVIEKPFDVRIVLDLVRGQRAA